MSSFYAQYVEEREGAITIENDKGFISYKFDGDYLFIVDLFIAKPYRRTKAGSQFGKQIEAIARLNGKIGIMCTAANNALNYKEAVQFIKSNGYKIISGTDEQTYFIKDLKE